MSAILIGRLCADEVCVHCEGSVMQIVRFGAAISMGRRLVRAELYIVKMHPSVDGRLLTVVSGCRVAGERIKGGA